MNVTYPLFVFWRDDRSMNLIEEPAHILYHQEAIDIRNDECVFWDVNGAGVCVEIDDGTFFSSGKVTKVSSCPPEFPLTKAFEDYVASLGLPWEFGDGELIDIWRSIQIAAKSRPKSLWQHFERLFFDIFVK